MAAASQGVTRDQLIWTQDAYVREDTYRAALATIITLNIACRSHGSGAMARLQARTGSSSAAQSAAPQAVTSTPATALIPVSASTLTSPTSMALITSR